MLIAIKPNCNLGICYLIDGISQDQNVRKLSGIHRLLEAYQWNKLSLCLSLLINLSFVSHPNVFCSSALKRDSVTAEGRFTNISLNSIKSYKPVSQK